MWELLTGRCPYEGEAQMEVAIAVAHRAHRPAQPEVCATEQWNLINVRCNCDLHRPFRTFIVGIIIFIIIVVVSLFRSNAGRRTRWRDPLLSSC